MKVIAGVFARGGSKGIPDKNLRVLGGRTLVQRAVLAAQACSGVERVIVSTDSEAIAASAREVGADVPWLRPPELAVDTAREWDAWRHLLDWLTAEDDVPDLFLMVPPTAPLRSVADLEACLDAASDPRVDVVITVCPARRNPWFNMVRISDDGQARLVLEPPLRIHRRQDAPEIFDVGTVAFVVRPSYLKRAESLYDGVMRAVEVPVERSIDIDDEVDLIVANALLDRRGDPL